MVRFGPLDGRRVKESQHAGYCRMSDNRNALWTCGGTRDFSCFNCQFPLLFYSLFIVALSSPPLPVVPIVEQEERPKGSSSSTLIVFTSIPNPISSFCQYTSLEALSPTAGQPNFQFFHISTHQLPLASPIQKWPSFQQNIWLVQAI